MLIAFPFFETYRLDTIITLMLNSITGSTYIVFAEKNAK